MKTKIYSLWAILIAFVCLTGCDDWEPATQFDKNMGGASFEGFELTVSDNPTVVSRAKTELEDYIVTIFNSEGKIATYEGKQCKWTYGKMPEVVSLRVGSYKLRVQSHEQPEPVAWDSPYFEGVEDFKIEDNKITALGTVTAKFSSIKVAVTFSELLTKNMEDDCKVAIVAGTGAKIEWTKNEKRYAYFDVTAGQTTLVATFQGTVRGSLQRSVQEFTNVAKGKYFIISYKMHSGDTDVPGENGDVDPAGITVKGDINEQTESGDVPGGNDGENPGRPDDEEWGDTPGPGPDDPGKDPSDDPVIFDLEGSALQLGADKTNPTSAVPAIVNIYAKPHGIEKLNVSIESDNADFIASAGGLIDLDFDLAHIPDDQVEAYGESLGLPVNDQVLGKGIDGPVVFDVTGLVPLLNPFPGRHTFKISVTDKNGNTKSTVLIFVV
ncbi:MAG: DUF4493 domain-containing protein [Duncaniella sp.]|nr:DUF4493 domain-containing protein [Duncaniella sp.]